MGFLDTVTEGLGGVLVEQIKQRGLVVLLLLLLIIALIYRDNNNLDNIEEESRNVKIENKELRMENKGELIANQRLIIANQVTIINKADLILEILRPQQQYKNEQRNGN